MDYIFRRRWSEKSESTTPPPSYSPSISAPFSRFFGSSDSPPPYERDPPENDDDRSRMTVKLKVLPIEFEDDDDDDDINLQTENVVFDPLRGSGLSPLEDKNNNDDDYEPSLVKLDEPSFEASPVKKPRRSNPPNLTTHTTETITIETSEFSQSSNYERKEPNVVYPNLTTPVIPAVDPLPVLPVEEFPSQSAPLTPSDSDDSEYEEPVTKPTKKKPKKKGKRSYETTETTVTTTTEISEYEKTDVLSQFTETHPESDPNHPALPVTEDLPMVEEPPLDQPKRSSLDSLKGSLMFWNKPKENQPVEEPIPEVEDVSPVEAPIHKTKKPGIFDFLNSEKPEKPPVDVEEDEIVEGRKSPVFSLPNIFSSRNDRPDERKEPVEEEKPKKSAEKTPDDVEEDEIVATRKSPIFTLPSFLSSNNDPDEEKKPTDTEEKPSIFNINPFGKMFQGSNNPKKNIPEVEEEEIPELRIINVEKVMPEPLDQEPALESEVVAEEEIEFQALPEKLPSLNEPTETDINLIKMPSVTPININLVEHVPDRDFKEEEEWKKIVRAEYGSDEIKDFYVKANTAQEKIINSDNDLLSISVLLTDSKPCEEKTQHPKNAGVLSVEPSPQPPRYLEKKEPVTPAPPVFQKEEINFVRVTEIQETYKTPIKEKEPTTPFVIEPEYNEPKESKIMFIEAPKQQAKPAEPPSLVTDTENDTKEQEILKMATKKTIVLQKTPKLAEEEPVKKSDEKDNLLNFEPNILENEEDPILKKKPDDKQPIEFTKSNISNLVYFPQEKTAQHYSNLLIIYPTISDKIEEKNVEKAPIQSQILDLNVNSLESMNKHVTVFHTPKKLNNRYVEMAFIDFHPYIEEALLPEKVDPVDAKIYESPPIHKEVHLVESVLPIQHEPEKQTEEPIPSQDPNLLAEIITAVNDREVEKNKKDVLKKSKSKVFEEIPKAFDEMVQDKNKKNEVSTKNKDVLDELVLAHDKLSKENDKKQKLKPVKDKVLKDALKKVEDKKSEDAKKDVVKEKKSNVLKDIPIAVESKIKEQNDKKETKKIQKELLKDIPQAFDERETVKNIKQEVLESFKPVLNNIEKAVASRESEKLDRGKLKTKKDLMLQDIPDAFKKKENLKKLKKEVETKKMDTVKDIPGAFEQMEELRNSKTEVKIIFRPILKSLEEAVEEKETYKKHAEVVKDKKEKVLKEVKDTHLKREKDIEKKNEVRESLKPVLVDLKQAVDEKTNEKVFTQIVKHKKETVLKEVITHYDYRINIEKEKEEVKKNKSILHNDVIKAAEKMDDLHSTKKKVKKQSEPVFKDLEIAAKKMEELKQIKDKQKEEPKPEQELVMMEKEPTISNKPVEKEPEWKKIVKEEYGEDYEDFYIKNKSSEEKNINSIKDDLSISVAVVQSEIKKPENVQEEIIFSPVEPVQSVPVSQKPEKKIEKPIEPDEEQLETLEILKKTVVTTQTIVTKEEKAETPIIIPVIPKPLESQPVKAPLPPKKKEEKEEEWSDMKEVRFKVIREVTSDGRVTLRTIYEDEVQDKTAFEDYIKSSVLQTEEAEAAMQRTATTSILTTTDERFLKEKRKWTTWKMEYETARGFDDPDSRRIQRTDSDPLNAPPPIVTPRRSSAQLKADPNLFTHSGSTRRSSAQLRQDFAEEHQFSGKMSNTSWVKHFRKHPEFPIFKLPSIEASKDRSRSRENLGSFESDLLSVPDLKTQRSLSTSNPSLEMLAAAPNKTFPSRSISTQPAMPTALLLSPPGSTTMSAMTETETLTTTTTLRKRHLSQHDMYNEEVSAVETSEHDSAFSSLTLSADDTNRSRRPFSKAHQTHQNSFDAPF